MLLLITKNPLTVEIFSETAGKNFEVAMSLESAFLRVRKRNYSAVVVDEKDISSYMFLSEKVMSLKTFLAKKEEKQKHIKGIEIKTPQTVAITSCKGSAGKTELIKKLISVLTGYRTLIVDMNFYDGGGDLSFEFDLPVLPHLGCFLKQKGDLKERFFACVYSLCKNVDIIQSPPKLSLIEDLRKEDLERIIFFAKENYDVIIFEIPPLSSREDLIQTAFKNSDRKVAVISGLKVELERLKHISADMVVSKTDVSELLSGKFKLVTFKDFYKILM